MLVSLWSLSHVVVTQTLIASHYRRLASLIRVLVLRRTICVVVALMATAMVVLCIACHTGSTATVIVGCTGLLGRASTSTVFWSFLLWMVRESIAAVLLVRWCSVLTTIARIMMSVMLLIVVIRLAAVWIVLNIAPCCRRRISDDWTLP